MPGSRSGPESTRIFSDSRPSKFLRFAAGTFGPGIQRNPRCSYPDEGLSHRYDAGFSLSVSLSQSRSAFDHFPPQADSTGTAPLNFAVCVSRPDRATLPHPVPPRGTVPRWHVLSRALLLLRLLLLSRAGPAEGAAIDLAPPGADVAFAHIPSLRHPALTVNSPSRTAEGILVLHAPPNPRNPPRNRGIGIEVPE